MDNHNKELDDKTKSLIHKAQDGDEEAFSSLYRIYADRLKAGIRKNLGQRLKSKVETEDLVQSVWKDLLPDLKKFKYQGPDSFFRWFSLKVIRKIQDKGKYFSRGKRDVKKEKRLSTTKGAPPIESADPTPSQAAISKERLDQLMGLLDHLSDPQRQTIVYRLRDNMEFNEIAEAMDTTPGAVRQLYNRALKKIHDHLGKTRDDQ